MITERLGTIQYVYRAVALLLGVPEWTSQALTCYRYRNSLWLTDRMPQSIRMEGLDSIGVLRSVRHRSSDGYIRVFVISEKVY